MTDASEATILEQGMITSAGDISRLGIVDWNRLNGYWNNDVTAPIRIINTWIANHAQYTIIEHDLKQYPEHPSWPGWAHAGRHERLGRLYWNMFHACMVGTITFSDSPDFCGTLVPPLVEKEVTFHGDIGKVSASTFIFTLMSMNAGDLWISVKSETIHIVIELLANVQRIWSTLLEKQLGIGQFTDQVPLMSTGEISISPPSKDPHK